MKIRRKWVTIFLFVASIVSFGMCLWLRHEKALVDINKMSLSEYVDRKTDLQGNIYLYLILGVILLLASFIINYKGNKHYE